MPRDYKGISIDLSRNVEGIKGREEGWMSGWMNGSAIKMVKVKHQNIIRGLNIMWVLWKQRRMLGGNILPII